MPTTRQADPLPSRSWGIGAWLLPALLFGFAFLRLPATQTMDYAPQPWEGALSFAASHHLHWGREIIFTYGPLGFLINDYYWGDHFWPVLIWALTFAITLTVLFLRFWRRIISPARILLCVALPVLTIPRSADLGYDPLYLFAIILVGITCLPDKKVSTPILTVSALLLGLLGLFKFTFCVYAAFTLLAVVAANVSSRNFGRAALIAGSALFSFCLAWLLAGQSVADLVPWFQNSLQVASGYSSAMSVPAPVPKLILGLLVLFSLLILLAALWHNTRETFAQLPRAAIISAGIFLAWKEGFDRADSIHINMFLLFAAFLVAIMPAFFCANLTGRLRFLPLTAAILVWVILPVGTIGSGFGSAIKAGFVPKLKDTFTALGNPLGYKSRLEDHLIGRRDAAALPQISTLVGSTPVAVLGYYPDIAVLNGFNCQPQPVFQNYSAYTPGLQRLNADFFTSTNAPQFVLWNYGTINPRFPALDDGPIILTVLNNYTPVLPEKEYILWKRNSSPGRTFQLIDPREVTTNLDRWVLVSTNATWLTVHLQHTWLGDLKEFFYQATLPSIEVQLSDGKTFQYLLVSGEAESGFVINPLIATERDLFLPALGVGKPLRVSAVRISSEGNFFKDSVRYVFQRIEGVPVLDRELTVPSPPTAP